MRLLSKLRLAPVVHAMILMALPLASVAESKPLCGPTALRAATYIDGLGWGRVSGNQLSILGIMKDGVSADEIVTIRSNVSGYRYVLDMRIDANTESCIVMALKAETM